MWSCFQPNLELPFYRIYSPHKMELIFLLHYPLLSKQATNQCNRIRLLWVIFHKWSNCPHKQIHPALHISTTNLPPHKLYSVRFLFVSFLKLFLPPFPVGIQVQNKWVSTRINCDVNTVSSYFQGYNFFKWQIFLKETTITFVQVLQRKNKKIHKD